MHISRTTAMQKEFQAWEEAETFQNNKIPLLTQMKVTWFYRLSLGQPGFTYQKEWYVNRFSSKRSPHPGISFSILFLKRWLSHLYKHVLQTWKIRTNLLGVCVWKWQKRHYGFQPWVFMKKKMAQNWWRSIRVEKGSCVYCLLGAQSTLYPQISREARNVQYPELSFQRERYVTCLSRKLEIGGD